MKKYFCDVCGAELGEGGNAPPSPAAGLCGLEDLCPRCEGFARKLDAGALVLEALRRMAEKRPEASAPPPVPAPPPALTGRNAREKQEILTAVEAYRREHGPGSTAGLARRAGLEEGTLRGMILRENVPIAAWRKVGKALGVAGAGGRREQNEP